MRVPSFLLLLPSSSVGKQSQLLIKPTEVELVLQVGVEIHNTCQNFLVMTLTLQKVDIEFKFFEAPPIDPEPNLPIPPYFCYPTLTNVILVVIQ